MNSQKKRQEPVKKGATGLRAVVLAGGRGVRLRPFTVNFPKPLVPLGDKPVLEILLHRLRQHGIRDVTLALGHLAELIKAYFHHKRELTSEIRLRYIEESTPTGTAGSLANISGLKDTFLVMNGDLLTNLDIDALVEFHRRSKAALTIATHKRTVKIDLGVLTIGNDDLITDYTEKPETAHHVSMGIYVYEPRVLRFIKKGEYLDFPNLVLKLLASGEKVAAFRSDCMWLDIGRPDDYAKAQDLFAENRNSFEHV